MGASSSVKNSHRCSLLLTFKSKFLSTQSTRWGGEGLRMGMKWGLDIGLISSGMILNSGTHFLQAPREVPEKAFRTASWTPWQQIQVHVSTVQE